MPECISAECILPENGNVEIGEQYTPPSLPNHIAVKHYADAGLVRNKLPQGEELTIPDGFQIAVTGSYCIGGKLCIEAGGKLMIS